MRNRKIEIGKVVFWSVTRGVWFAFFVIFLLFFFAMLDAAISFREGRRGARIVIFWLGFFGLRSWLGISLNFDLKSTICIQFISYKLLNNVPDARMRFHLQGVSLQITGKSVLEDNFENQIVLLDGLSPKKIVLAQNYTQLDCTI